MKVLSRLLIGFSIFCYTLGIYNTWLQNDPNRLAFTNYSYDKTSSVNTKGLPTRITIKELGINLPIIPAEIRNNQWDVTADGASYLTSSHLPGTDGNSIIYAHNWASLFGNLVNAKQGDVVEIAFADKSVKKFVIESTATVSPNESKFLAPSQDKRITLYTCTGWLDSKRFIVVAHLEDHKEN
jgi:LPXTG-site transpeptidase (sortase) family protein